MKMKLFSSKTSPFVRKVRVSLLELGLEGLVDEVPTDYIQGDAAFLAANPLGQIPALVTDKGEALAGSDLIIEYLLSRGSGLASLPRGSARWSRLKLAQLADGMTEAAVSVLPETRRAAGEQSPGWIARKEAAVRRSLDALEAGAAELSAETPSVVEISVGCALGYLDFRFARLEWRQGRPALAAWFASFAERPSMLATVPVA